MRRLMIAIACLTALCACSERTVQVPNDTGGGSPEPLRAVPVKQLTDADKLALLRTEAHKRGLKWRIFCNPVAAVADPMFQFISEAAPRDGEFAFFREDGGKGLWLAGGSTQAEAAFNLYRSIKRPMTNPAIGLWDDEPEPEAPRRKRICPPELHGE